MAIIYFTLYSLSSAPVKTGSTCCLSDHIYTDFLTFTSFIFITRLSLMPQPWRCTTLRWRISGHYRLTISQHGINTDRLLFRDRLKIVFFIKVAWSLVSCGYYCRTSITCWRALNITVISITLSTDSIVAHSTKRPKVLKMKSGSLTGSIRA